MMERLPLTKKALTVRHIDIMLRYKY